MWLLWRERVLSVCSETQSLIKTTSVRKVVGNKQKRGGGGDDEKAVGWFASTGVTESVNAGIIVVGISDFCFFDCGTDD